MKLVSILDPELTFCRVDGASRGEIYGKMLSEAAKKIELKEPVASIAGQMIEREDALNTPGMEIGLPHLRVDSLDDLYIIVATLAHPILLRKDDLEPCRIVVMSLISPDTSDTYLKSISAFARYFSQPGKVDAFCRATTAHAALEIVKRDDVTIKKNITAEDLMDKDFSPLSKDESLSVALDSFCKNKKLVLPVVDKNNVLIGQLSARSVIKSFIPDYMFMMDNINFLNSFETFDRIFKEESVQKVSDFMEKKVVTVTADTPLIQFTVRLVKGETEEIFVTESGGKLAGVISLDSILRRVLRG